MGRFPASTPRKIICWARFPRAECRTDRPRSFPGDDSIALLLLPAAIDKSSRGTDNRAVAITWGRSRNRCQESFAGNRPSGGLAQMTPDTYFSAIACLVVLHKSGYAKGTSQRLSLPRRGHKIIATGGVRSDDSRTKRNPWFPCPSPQRPGRADRDASTAVAPAGAIGEFSPLFHGFRVAVGDNADRTLHPWLQSHGPSGAKCQGLPAGDTDLCKTRRVMPPGHDHRSPSAKTRRGKPARWPLGRPRLRRTPKFAKQSLGCLSMSRGDGSSTGQLHKEGGLYL